MSESDGERPLADEPGLRERRRHETRRLITEAAIDLFTRQGVDETTSDQIAAAAGVSPRTFFRYAATKEHAIFVADDGPDRLLSAVIAHDRLSGPPGAKVHAIEQTYLELLHDFDSQTLVERERFLHVRELVLTHQSLLALALARDADVLERIVAELHSDAQGSLSEPQARAVITVIGTAFRLTLDEWSRRMSGGEDVNTVTLYREIRSTLATHFALDCVITSDGATNSTPKLGTDARDGDPHA